MCTHNPTVKKFGDRYYLYYTGNTGNGINTLELNWSHRNNQRIGAVVGLICAAGEADYQKTFNVQIPLKIS